MQVSADTLDVQRAKRASEMVSEVRRQQGTEFTRSTLGACPERGTAAIYLCGIAGQALDSSCCQS